MIPERVEQVGAGRVQVGAGPVHRQPHAFEQVPVGSQLRLADGVVAASYRHRVPVTAQPRGEEFAFDAVDIGGLAESWRVDVDGYAGVRVAEWAASAWALLAPDHTTIL